MAPAIGNGLVIGASHCCYGILVRFAGGSILQGGMLQDLLCLGSTTYSEGVTVTHEWVKELDGAAVLQSIRDRLTQPKHRSG